MSWELGFGLLELLGPTIVGILTVPVMNGIKRLVSFVDGWPAALQQITAVLIAVGLTELGQLLSVALPGDLALFTGADVEALLSAAMAFGIHAGKKARGLPTVALLTLLLMPTPGAAQTDTVTVTVVDVGNAAAIITTDSTRFRGVPGDTVTFEAVAVDPATGDTLQAVFSWASSSPVVDINPVTGFATFVGGCGEVVCRAEVVVMVAQITGMVIMRMRDDGTWQELFAPSRVPIYAARGFAPDSLRLDVGDTAQLCAYLEDDQERHYIAPDVEWSSSDTTIVRILPGGTFDCPPWSPGFPFPEPAQQLPMPEAFDLQRLLDDVQARRVG